MRWMRPDLLAVAACLGVLTAAGGQPFLLVSLFVLELVLCLNRRLLLFLLVLTFLLFYGSTALHHLPKTFSTTPFQSMTGRIFGNPAFDGDKVTLTFETSTKIKVYAKLYAQNLSEKQSLEKLLLPGESCTFNGKFQEPSSNRNPYGFNFKTYLLHKDIQLNMQLTAIKNCQVTALNPLERFERLRLLEINRLSPKLPSAVQELFFSLVFGTKSSFSSTDLSAYQTLGISHLLAVSGLHVAIISTSVLMILRRLGMTKEVSERLLLIIVLPLYILLTGASPSVLRAGSMIALIILAEQFKRPLLPLTALVFIGLVLLLFSPLMIYQISFQLSFLVTFIILMSWRIVAAYPNRILQLLTLSGIAQIGALPLTLYHFFQLSWISFGINVLYVPFITVIVLPFCLILFLLILWLPYSIFSVFLKPVNRLFSELHLALIHLTEGGFGVTNIGRPSAIETMMLIAGLILTFKLWENFRLRKWSVGWPFIFTGVIISIHFFIPLLNPFGKVVFFDVGQGDSIFIQLPHRGQTILIDTGGQLAMPKANWQVQKKPFEVGHDVVLNELKGMGVTHLDILVLTHKDADHIGGAKGIVGQIPIQTIMVSPYFVPSASERAWLTKAKALGTKLIIEKPGDSWQSKKAVFRVLWPAEKTTTSNGTSLVIQGVFGGASWLFTGDLEVPEEKKLLALYPDLKVDILKVGHHGSKTASSEEFLTTIQPKLAIISVGQNNRYGHPNKEVIERLSGLKIPFLRTDQFGGITVSFDATHIVSIEPTIRSSN